MGAAVVLGTDNSALNILNQGYRARELRAQREAAAQAKRDAERGKQLVDAVKFPTDGSHLFGNALQQQVYQPLLGKITPFYRSDSGLDEVGRRVAAQPHLQQADSETVQSKAKTAFVDEKIRAAQADKALYNVENLSRGLSARLHAPDGRELLPSQFDEEQWHQDALANADNYNEPEVIKRSVKDLFPAVTQRIAEAGTLGGQHFADQVKGRFVAYDGHGRPVLNADGSPQLNLTKDTEALLDQGLLKLQVDKRAAAYEARRAADPSLPVMTRRGHLATMLGPLASYDTAHDEGLNARVAPPRTGAAPKFTVLPNTGGGGAAGVGIADHGRALNYPTPYVGQAPQKQKPSGEVVSFSHAGAVHNTFIRQIPGRDDEVVANNKEPQDVQYGGHFTALVTPSGKLVRPHNEAALSPEQLHRYWQQEREKDSRLTVETVITGSPAKGKNRLGDRESVAQALASSYGGRGHRPSHEELLKKADDLIGQQNATYQYVYRDGTKREIDAFAPGAYNGPEKAAEIERARRAADQASAPRQLRGPAAALQHAQASTVAPGTPTPTSIPTGNASRFRKKR
ncbi:hypothetical protein [Hymenobacter sp. PAMC 26628]|uniref:hypothetical protein n=1 Tax=Hymenobacter sp. PAMC 26628 TaxID=1484118 RepID=UPI00076FF4D5|nr:hypothetical protein [Hymenobacter sp. PAMC 26628]AMJ67193.1 hypothetical protein AXW84_18480 [Hymenobacter sp. PAMC 26628]